MLKSQRVAVLVDSENLEISVARHYEPGGRYKNTHLAYPDWKSIIPRIVGERTLIRNLYYKKRSKKVSDKFSRLWKEELGGEIKQPIKSVDPYIIIDAITLSEKADVIVLLAGDKDYLPLIWYLKSKGCKVEMASFAEAASSEVKSTSDRFYFLDEDDTVIIKRTY